jgi:cellulose synthase/poly-beta-1,6-N-acetylglucosamine synthase-like glycosyltransferase
MIAARPILSVIVPALNEARVIGRCLDSLLRQSMSRDDFEVVLVDNGSTDETLEIARRFQQALPLRLLQKRGVHISALRNYGAAEARGEFLAFLDADCIAPPDWLSQAIHRLTAPGCGVIGAHYTIPPGSQWVARAWYGDLSSRNRGRVSYVPAGCMLVSREAFQGIGGFDQTVQTSEDCELCQRASAAGIPVEAVPALSVVHLGTPQTVAAFYRKQRWHGKDVHAVFLRNLRNTSHARSTLFALFTLCCLAALLTVAPTAILLGMYAVAAAPALLLLAGVLPLAARAAMARKRWSLVAPLTFLYLVYGLARALCLLGISGSRRSGLAAAAVEPEGSS